MEVDSLLTISSSLPLHRERSCSTEQRARFLALLGIGLFALTVYVAFLLILPRRWARNESTDYTLIYEPVARNIAQGRGCINSDGSLATRYPPGYSLILAALFKVAGDNKSLEASLSLVLTGFVVIFSPLSMFAITGLAFDRNASIASALLCATYPFFLWLTKQPNSEIPFLIFFLPAMLLFLGTLHSEKLKYWHAFLAGILLGLASLVRPIAIALSIALILGLLVFGPKWSRHQKAVFSGVLLFGNFLAVFPWELVARRNTGNWILLSTGGPPSIVDGLTFAVSPTNGHTQVSPELRAFMEATEAQKEQLQSMGAIAKYLAQQVVSRPSAVTQLITLKIARAWYANDRQSLEHWILLLQIPYLVLAGCGLYKTSRMGMLQRRFTGLILLVVGYFWLMTIMSLSILRYMVPAMMMLMPIVALGADAVRIRLKAPTRGLLHRMKPLSLSRHSRCSTESTV